MDSSAAAYTARRDALLTQLRVRAGAAPLGLAKSTSNLFRDRAGRDKQRLDLTAFVHVLQVDPVQRWVDAEGLTTFDALVDATLTHAVMPAVVPQLKTITLGGAAAGVGIEATSFRHGLVHDSLLELDVLLSDGDVVLATPHNEHRDLFFGFPNSYGTLGYALRLRQRTLPVLPFVRVEHHRHDDPQTLFAALAAACDGDADFIDAVAFGPRSLVLNSGRFAGDAPQVSDYTYQRIYYRSLLDTEIDHLRTRDYLWRWDTDWFWCSKNVGAQHPWLRPLFGRRHLNSRTYTRIMRWNAQLQLTQRWARLRGDHPEAVIQDVDIPIGRAAEFLEFLLREIGIVPVWLCPLRSPDPTRRFALYPVQPGALYVNFGFWDTVHSPVAYERGHFNRLVEREVARLRGIKSLYSDSYFTRDEFDAAYGMQQYAALKARYDPHHRLLGLYEKCVQRA
ncbi:MAG TPA: FAD-binding oxidoreductase [Burkholderiaceae bacterium]|nr:FAD-binding oxidoreductase [Burkholderiaceae bacterium]